MMIKARQILISPIRAVIGDMEDTVDYIFCSSERTVIEGLERCPGFYSNLLLLHFLDTEEDAHPMAFQERHAETIIAFLARNDANKTLFVCCDSGESRSSAIAAAILRAIGQSDRDIWESTDYHPNQLVFRKMCQTLGVD